MGDHLRAGTDGDAAIAKRCADALRWASAFGLQAGDVETNRVAGARYPRDGRWKGYAMKIHMDMEITPEEARTLFGLPDVKPMQQAMMGEIESRMKKALTAMEPEAMIKMWLPASIQGLEQWQKFIWSRMTGGAGSSAQSDESKAP
jgi:hypothetical protein